MVTGILLICASVSVILYNTSLQRNALLKSSSVLAQLVPEIPEPNPSPYAGIEAEIADNDGEMTVVEIDGYGYVGYIRIPALGLELPVMSEWDYGRLKIAPCRQYGTARGKNLIIAAHNYDCHFKNIGNLQPGDVVSFTDMDGNVYTYNVCLVEYLYPNDGNAMVYTDWDLTLYTCTYGGAKRITVRCERIK